MKSTILMLLAILCLTSCSEKKEKKEKEDKKILTKSQKVTESYAQADLELEFENEKFLNNVSSFSISGPNPIHLRGLSIRN